MADTHSNTAASSPAPSKPELASAPAPSKYIITPVPRTLSAFTAWTSAQLASFGPTENVMHDAVFQPLSPDPALAQRELHAMAERHLAGWKAHGDAAEYVQILSETGDVMAGAKWAFHLDDNGAGRPERVVVGWVGEEGSREREFAQRCMDVFHGRRVSEMRGRHALLDILFVSPAHERKGLASALVDYGTARCDQFGLVGYVEGSIPGKPVYERKGFVVEKRMQLRWDDFPEKADAVWFHQVRQPRVVVG